MDVVVENTNTSVDRTQIVIDKYYLCLHRYVLSLKRQFNGRCDKIRVIPGKTTDIIYLGSGPDYKKWCYIERTTGDIYGKSSRRPHGSIYTLYDATTDLAKLAIGLCVTNQ